MAAGDPVQGESLVVRVSATSSGTTTDVNGMNRYGSRKSRPINRTSVFMRAAQYVSRGVKDYSFTLSGLLIMDDAGQQLLRDAEESGDTVFLTVLPDGTNGFKQEVIVGNLSHDADPDALQTYGFEFTGTASPVAVGTGPIT